MPNNSLRQYHTRKTLPAPLRLAPGAAAIFQTVDLSAFRARLRRRPAYNAPCPRLSRPCPCPPIDAPCAAARTAAHRRNRAVLPRPAGAGRRESMPRRAPACRRSCGARPASARAAARIPSPAARGNGDCMPAPWPHAIAPAIEGKARLAAPAAACARRRGKVSQVKRLPAARMFHGQFQPRLAIRTIMSAPRAAALAAIDGNNFV